MCLVIVIHDQFNKLLHCCKGGMLGSIRSPNEDYRRQQLKDRGLYQKKVSTVSLRWLKEFSGPKSGSNSDILSASIHKIAMVKNLASEQKNTASHVITIMLLLPMVNLIFTF